MTHRNSNLIDINTSDQNCVHAKGVTEIQDLQRILKENPNSITIYHQNIRSIRKNFNELMAMLSVSQLLPDVLILSEIWAYGDEISHYEYKGYKTYSMCNNSYRSGGIAVYCKEGLKVSYTSLSFQTADCGKIIVTAPGQTITCICIYRLHRHRIEDFVKELDEYLATVKCKNVAVLGDLNLDISVQRRSTAAEEYLQVMSKYGMNCTNLIPTRECGDQTPSVIDHIFVRTREVKTKSYVVNSKVTDHRLTALLINIKTQREYQRNTITYRTDAEKFKQQVQSLDFEGLKCETDLNMAYNKFENLLTAALSNSKSPKRLKKTKKGEPWISKKLKDMIREKYRLIKGKGDKDRIKVLGKSIKTAIKHEKEKYYENRFLACKGNSRKQWELINSMTGGVKKKDSCIKLEENGEEISEPNDVGNKLNDYFVNIPVNIKRDMPAIEVQHPSLQCFSTPSRSNSMFLHPVTACEVSKCIKSLKSGKCAGLDGLTVECLKSVGEEIGDILAFFINWSFEAGVFPETLKRAEVIPIYKKGDRRNVSAYRPISILKVISKVFEKLLHGRLYDFLEGWLSTKQYGFRKNRSTEDAMLDYSNTIQEAINKGHKSGSLLIDLSSAFDCLDKKILISTLEKAGVRGKVLDLFSNYLTGRTQRVKGTNRDAKIVHGTPQGGTLSPLLFIVYINEICEYNFHGSLFAYADDCALVYECESHEELVKQVTEDLYMMNLWFTSRKLALNVGKTKFITFSLTTKQQNIGNVKAHVPFCKDWQTCQCKLVERVDHIKYLGVTFQSNMKFNLHTAEVNGVGRSFLRKLFYLRQYAPKYVQKGLYQALVESKMSYGLVVWGATYLTSYRALNVTQKFIIRTITAKNKRHPSFPLFQTLNLLPLQHLFAYRTLKTFFRRSGTQATTTVPRIHNTRNQNVHVVPQAQSTLYQKSYCTVAPKWANLVPAEVKSFRGKGEKVFCKELKKWIFNMGGEVLGLISSTVT